MSNKFYTDEEWKEVELPGRDSGYMRYAVSNYGRLLSFSDKIENGKVIKGSMCNAYKSLNVRIENKRKHYYIHRLVGEYFLERPSKDHKKIIHLDFDKKNNHVDNLQWASEFEWWEHFQDNPNVREAREKMRDRKPMVGHKLTSTDVIRIKKMLYDPNRKTRLKMIAKQFDISEMQLYRIRTGENWGHITIPEEEEAKKRRAEKLRKRAEQEQQKNS